VSSPISSPWKKTLRWLPGVLISGIAIYAILKLVQFKGLSSAFSKASWQFLLIIFALDILSMMVRGIAWQSILGNHVTWKQAFFGVSEGYFLNNIFPFRAGELGRSIFVGKSSGLGTFHVLSTIVIERAFDIGIAAVLVLSTLPLVIGLSWVKTVAMTALVLVVAAFICLFLIARNKEKVASWIKNVGTRSPFLTKYIAPQATKLLDGLSALTNAKQFLVSFLWIALSWAMWVLIYDVLIWQLVPSAPIWNGAFIGSILALGVAIPSAPAAIGVYEASMVAALVILGGDQTSALAFALMMHVLQFLSSAIFGIWGLAREGQSLSSIYSRLQDPQLSESDPTLKVEELETK
jgi:glycosyltransferase 2 family protein